MGDIKASKLGGIPFGINSQRPSNPEAGQPFFNGEENRLEVYTQNVGWQNIVGETPGVISFSGEYLESNASNTLLINGTNFASGALAYVIGSNGVEVPAASTSVTSIVEISAVFSGLTPANEPYDIKVVNPSNLYGLLNDVLYINDTPVWTTSAGSLGTFNELTTQSIQLATTDDEGTARTYSVTSGALPSGLTLSSSGLISGTISEVSSTTTSNFTVTATDGKNPSPRAFSITTTNLSPTWVTASGNLSTFTRNVSYSATISATDAHTITYSVSSGSLPTGLNLNSTTGVISGTPSDGVAQTFTIRATNAGGQSADRSFTIPNVGPSWTTTSPVSTFTRNSPYSFTLVGADDSGNNPTYSIASGSLPTGLSLNSSTGVISGTPSSSTAVTFTARVTDVNGSTADRSFTMPNSGPVWVTTTLTSGAASVAYSQQVTATDDSGNAPSYSLLSGSLPTGLSLSSSGLISGTPSTYGTSTFTIRATDANGTTSDQSLSLSISSGIVASGGSVVTSGGYKYHTFTGSGTFSVSTSLPNAFEVLLVAGGGGGGNDVGGGGGAGGAIYRSAHTISNGSYPVVVGGGSPRRASGDTGNGASNSTFNGMTAMRGGGGTSWPNIVGLSGGGGGGGAGYPFDNGGKSSTQTSNGGGTGYGNAGGNGIHDPVFAGGGGGGAGGAGQNGSTTPSPGKCGDGGVGIGLFSAWASATGTGSSGYYAGGGGGSSDNDVATRGNGGLGGGGRGLFGNEANNSAGDGLANTGGGGGGCNAYPGGAGGSGICIVRYIA
jgi:hypothetical protein